HPDVVALYVNAAQDQRSAGQLHLRHEQDGSHSRGDAGDDDVLIRLVANDLDHCRHARIIYAICVELARLRASGDLLSRPRLQAALASRWSVDSLCGWGFV